MNNPTQSAAIAAVVDGRYVSRTELGDITEYLVRLPNGCLFVVLQWGDGTYTAEPQVTCV